MPRQLSASELTEYLMEVGSLIPQKKACSVVVIGGAVSVLLLHSRHSTEDVDVFTTNLDKKQKKCFWQACTIVADRHNLSSEWCNNTVESFYDSRDPIVLRSLQQNVLIGEYGNLRLYAAEVGASIKAKLRRFRKHDEDDIVNLIRWQETLSARSFDAWCQFLSIQPDTPVHRDFSRCWSRVSLRDKNSSQDA
ncbi:hypothetical protein DFJ77DRAFT_284992 [Powellomyces hirtus]|nr:hypothetical protein DFJ77DRAFT_284992 [Powellomyces hirtus]